MIPCKECGTQFKPRRASSVYCSRPCMWANNGGHNKKPETWWKNARGYIEGRVWLDNGECMRVKQHRYIMEKIMGRKLEAGEDVHHINGIRDDNRPENLAIIGHAEHASEHNETRVAKSGYTLNLTPEARENRRQRAIDAGLSAMGRAALAAARGEG